MRIICSLLGLTLLMGITAQAQLPSSLSNGLIAFYPFDGDGNDASGNGRNLVLGENTFTNGIRGQSMSIFGRNQASYGESRELPLLITNSFSFSLWMKPETLNRGWPEWIYLISGNAEVMNANLRIGVNDGSIVPAFRNLGLMEFINGGRGGDLNSYPTTNTASLKTNAWNHIVVTANGTNEIAIYANNQLLERWTNVPNFFFDQNNYFLGNGAGNQYPLQGQLDQTRVYNRALSSSEVTALYKQDVPLSQILPTVNIETVFVGDAGNAPDTTGFGSVSYPFHIGKFEVTIEQYAAFLNAVAATTTNSYVLDLWHPEMASNTNVAGISRTGSLGNYTYAVMENSGYSGQRPISYISWNDAARFANFLHNGATNGADTEDGAYTLNGATDGFILKNPSATFWIPSENEWYKAAYYKGNGTNSGYWYFPTQSDVVPQNSDPASANQANFYNGGFAVAKMTPSGPAWTDLLPTFQYLTTVGFFSNSPSAYGTFDQGGSMWEWNDARIGNSRGLRGGWWGHGANLLESTVRDTVSYSGDESFGTGFRVATRESSAMVVVKGGVLPSSSELSGQSVNSFRIGETEITWGEWKQVRDWAVANGYTDLSSIGTGGSDNHPVRLVNWYDAVKWCNAKSEKEGLKPVYYRSGQVYRQGEGPSDSPYDPNSPVQFVIDRDFAANGYRLPTDAEWEWAARGGVSSRDFIYSGSDDLNAVGWYQDNSSGAPAAFLNDRGTYPVGLKQPNELGIYDMSGNASEWVWDPLGDWRRVRGGAFHYLQEECAVDQRSADAAGYRDSDTYVKGGFRVASNTPLDFDTDEDGVNDYREGKDGTNPNDASSFNTLSKGLVAYYPFDDNANDESGNGNNGVEENISYQVDRFGNSNNAAHFASDFREAAYVEIPALQYSQYYPATYSVWLNMKKEPIPVTGSDDAFTVIGRMTVRDGGNGALMVVSDAAGGSPPLGDSNEIVYYGGGGVVRSHYQVSANNWFQLTFTYNSDQSASFYINGSLVAQAIYPAAQYSYEPFRIGASTILDGVDNNSTHSWIGEIDDVRIYNRPLTETEVRKLYYTEAFNDTQRTFLSVNPTVQGHYSQADYNGNRTNGQTDVTTNPSAFNLFTKAQFDSNRTAGQSDVISNPMLYGLYTSDSIMDLRMGGLMLQRQGNNATVIFQTQTTTDLATQSFENYGTPITNTVPMPSNKGFLRIQAR